MNCDCISEIKERIKTEFPKKSAEYANMVIKSIYLDGECFLYEGNKMVSGLSVPATIEHEPIGRKKKTTLNLAASFCPFCGKSTKYSESEATP